MVNREEEPVLLLLGRVRESPMSLKNRFQAEIDSRALLGAVAHPQAGSRRRTQRESGPRRLPTRSRYGAYSVDNPVTESAFSEQRGEDVHGKGPLSGGKHGPPLGSENARLPRRHVRRIRMNLKLSSF